MLSTNFDDRQIDSPTTRCIRKLFAAEQDPEQKLIQFYDLWKVFENSFDQVMLEGQSFKNSYISIPLLVKTDSEELFLKYFLQSYIVETHRILKELILYFHNAQAWAKLSACMFLELESNDSVFFEYLQNYGNILHANTDNMGSTSYDHDDAKAFQYLIKILVTFPLCSKYGLQAVRKGKSAAEKKTYKILRLIFYIMNKVVEAALSPADVPNVLRCKLLYLYYAEFQKPHLVLAEIVDSAQQDTDLAQELGNDKEFLVHVAPILESHKGLFATQSKFKILQFYANSAEGRQMKWEGKDWSAQFSTVRSVRSKFFEDFLSFLEQSPSYHKNKPSAVVVGRHVEYLKQIKASRDNTLSKFYQMFKLSFDKEGS